MSLLVVFLVALLAACLLLAGLLFLVFILALQLVDSPSCPEEGGV